MGTPWLLLYPLESAWTKHTCIDFSGCQGGRAIVIVNAGSCPTGSRVSPWLRSSRSMTEGGRWSLSGSRPLSRRVWTWYYHTLRLPTKGNSNTTVNYLLLEKPQTICSWTLSCVCYHMMGELNWELNFLRDIEIPKKNTDDCNEALFHSFW